MRKNSATPEIHPALSYRCPFCHSDPGQACRTERGRGREADYPHSRRIALTKPIEERRPLVRVNALCCVCGELRTVHEHHSSSRFDENRAFSALGESQGWRCTKTLKCAACDEQTRHAVLMPADSPYRDGGEEQQRIALGDPDTSRWGHLTDLERVRREYREMPFPRNPYLRHRRWTDEAEKAWDDGTKRVIALCGEPMEIKVDPRRPAKYKKQEMPGNLVAEQLSDTEYEDVETGLWWIDMDCVDCCRVSNQHHRAGQRKCLEELLSWFASHPERIEDADVSELLVHLERLAKPLYAK
jgi:hypothetical protein